VTLWQFFWSSTTLLVEEIGFAMMGGETGSHDFIPFDSNVKVQTISHGMASQGPGLAFESCFRQITLLVSFVL
jgi:hypothetical protein